MYYTVQAVRWDSNGAVSHLKWQPVDFDGDVITKGSDEAVTVLHAGAVCRTHEVRVYVPGETGQFFKMRACPEGVEADDAAETSLRERMAHLPQF